MAVVPGGHLCGCGLVGDGKGELLGESKVGQVRLPRVEKLLMKW